MLLLVDFEKAFDSVSWKFMYNCLKFFNFGPDFIRWIHIMNDDTKLCVIQNGIFSQFFGIGCGCRQGDPTSPYIFNICVEIMAILFRHNANIKGISIGNHEYCILQYADDTVLFLDGSEKSLKSSLDLLFQFAKYSGLTPNFEKTSVIWIGSKIKSADKFCLEYNLDWADGDFTILGIKFNAQLENIEKINYESKINMIKKDINHWSKRNLTPLGRITVVKTLLLSKVTHLFISLPNPSSELITHLDKLFAQFIWRGKVDRIARKILCQDHKNAGCRMIHISSFVKALKLTWIRRILQTNSSWVNLFNESTQCSIKSVCDFGNEYLRSRLKEITNPFWKDVLHSLCDFATLLPKRNISATLKSPLWHNCFIKIDKRPIFIKKWHDSGITLIQDLFTDNGDFMTLYDFQQKYNFTPPFTTFQGIKLAILSTWPELRNIDGVAPRPCKPSFIEYICRNKKGSRDMYDIFIEELYMKPKSERKWETELNLVPLFDWKTANAHVLKITKDTNFIWFHYRLIHRILPTRKYLYYMKLTNSPLCNFCNEEEDTFLHAFFECEHVNDFWNNVKDWVNQNSNNDIHLSKTDIIFGKFGSHQNALNIILLICKMYIFRSARESNRLSLHEIKLKIQYYYQVEKKAFFSKGKYRKFTKRWQEYLHLVEAIN